MERECARSVSACVSIILTPFPPVLLWVLSFYTMWTAIGASTWFFSVPPEEVCILMYLCHVEGRLAESYCNCFSEVCIKDAHVRLLARTSECVAGCSPTHSRATSPLSHHDCKSAHDYTSAQPLIRARLSVFCEDGATTLSL